MVSISQSPLIKARGLFSAHRTIKKLFDKLVITLWNANTDCSHA